MPCYHPVKGWKTSTGGLTFNRGRSPGVVLTVPCGQCIGCRLERSRQWAVRMMHEASQHERNSFVTLTYSPENLPPYGSLRKADFQKFMKRLRKRFAPQRVRFFHAGEYGEGLGRPHYHACLFGLGFPDAEPSTVRGGHPVWRSAILSDLWGLGLAEGGSVTFESAAYVARYVCKKVTGRGAADHYAAVDPESGEVVEVEPEYATMSRRPGIGAGWFERFGSEVYPADEVVMRGALMKPPRYYDLTLEKVNPDLHAEVVRSRRLESDPWNQTEPRLAVREAVAQSRMSIFATRSLEKES